MKQSAIIFKLSALAFCSALACYGQQQLILRAATGQGPAVEAKYSLALVRALNSTGDVALVTAGNAAATKAFLTAAATDTSILSVEADQETDVSESASSKARNSVVSGKVDPLVTGGVDLVNYYGTNVRSGYVNQNAAVMIELGNAQAAYSATGTGVVVAIIDTGVDPQHPMLAGKIVRGYDFVNNVAGIPSELVDVSLSTVALLDQMGTPAVSAGSQTPVALNLSTVALLDLSTVALLDLSTVALLDKNGLPEDFGHGTMVAGLVHLVAPGAQIMPLKAFKADGTGNISDVVRAIYFATDNGAKVINMSFSTTTASAALTAAIQYGKAHKVILVSSAGNNGSGKAVYPAANGTIGVASVNSGDLRSFFSNYGEANARTSAPGEALITGYPGGSYAGVWGTSFSTALVSGTAALMLQMNPHASQGDFSDALGRGKKIGDQNIGDASLDVYLDLARSTSDN